MSPSLKFYFRPQRELFRAKINTRNSSSGVLILLIFFLLCRLEFLLTQNQMTCMGDVYPSLMGVALTKALHFHFILFFSQKKEEHIDKSIRNISMAIINHCRTARAVAGQASSKVQSLPRSRLLSLRARPSVALGSLRSCSRCP